MKYLKTPITFICLLLAFTALNASNKKTNVIIIITDDQGYGDIAANGHPVAKTPNMDKLHKNGVRLENFHCGTTCAPSRSGFLSGADGNRAGVWHTVGGCNVLREKFVLMPQVFKENGYATGMFGKWHLGDGYPYEPHDRGFQEAVYHGAGGVGQTPDYWENDYFDDTYYRNGKPEKFKGYCTDVFFAEAMDFIEKKKEEPFFIYIAPNAPHSPYNVEKEYFDLYKNEESLTDEQKSFYGMITNIDDNMGLLDKKLEELGIKDNTILIFTTDNGTATGIRKIKGEEVGFNAGMSGKKGSQYDGGHRVPFFMRWENGNLKKGLAIDQITMNYDVLPTLISMCGLSKVPGPLYDGVDLAPVIRQEVKTLPHRYCVVDNNRIQQPKKWRMCSVMDDEWRLIDGKKLYHIVKDPGQKNNIAAQHPEKVQDMRAAYENWWQYTSRDFGYFEAYKIGDRKEEYVITAHDLHTYTQVAWFQSHIRDPRGGRKPALAKGYWMIDLEVGGKYEVELRRWPKESGLKFNDITPQLGVESGWYDAMPKGVLLNLDKAVLDIAAIHLEEEIDMTKDNVTFTTYLHEGRQRLEANFIEDGGDEYAAFYVYMRKVKD